LFLHGKNIFKIFFSRTTGSKELKLTRKLSDIVQNRVFKIMAPGGATIGETVLTYAYKGNIFKRSSQEPMGPESSD
jgi:hypothetical protein